MKRKVLASLLVIAVVAGLVGAGTFAYFSDVETSSGNSFTAGTLDLNVDGANDPLLVKFTLGPIAPGDSGSVTYVLANAGNIAGYVDLESVVVANDDNNCTEPEAAVDGTCGPTGGGELGANLTVTVTVGGTVLYGPASLDGFNSYSGGDVPLGAYPSTINAVIAWSLPGTVGNIVQSDSAGLSITFELAQTAAQ